MRKILALTTTLIMAVGLFACGNTSTSQPVSSSKASTAPTSSVAEVKNEYIAIGGINPYEELTPTEEANIKKAEEERLQAEAKAKADAEAKAKAQAQAQQAEQQAQPQQGGNGIIGYKQLHVTNLDTGETTIQNIPEFNSRYEAYKHMLALARKRGDTVDIASLEREIAEMEATGQYN